MKKTNKRRLPVYAQTRVWEKKSGQLKTCDMWPNVRHPQTWVEKKTTIIVCANRILSDKKDNSETWSKDDTVTVSTAVRGCHGCKVSQRNCYHFTMCHQSDQTPKYGHQNRLKLDLTWLRPPKNPVKWVKTQKNGPKSWLDPSWPDFFFQIRVCAYTLMNAS